MKDKYIATKLETIRRVEKIQYVVSIPEKIKNKEEYVLKQVGNGNYISCKVVDIVDSEMLDEEFVSLDKSHKQIRNKR